MKMTVFWGVAPCSLVENDTTFQTAQCPIIREMPETSVHFYDITRFSIREGKLPNTWKDAREPQQDRSNVMTNNY
jgi:hypothetical protein